MSPHAEIDRYWQSTVNATAATNAKRTTLPLDVVVPEHRKSVSVPAERMRSGPLNLTEGVRWVWKRKNAGEPNSVSPAFFLVGAT